MSNDWNKEMEEVLSNRENSKTINESHLSGMFRGEEINESAEVKLVDPSQFGGTLTELVEGYNSGYQAHRVQEMAPPTLPASPDEEEIAPEGEPEMDGEVAPEGEPEMDGEVAPEGEKEGGYSNDDPAENPVDFGNEEVTTLLDGAKEMYLSLDKETQQSLVKNVLGPKIKQIMGVENVPYKEIHDQLSGSSEEATPEIDGEVAPEGEPMASEGGNQPSDMSMGMMNRR